jgi:hypothetical protein
VSDEIDEEARRDDAIARKVLQLRSSSSAGVDHVDLSNEAPAPGLFQVSLQPASLADPNWMRGLIALVLVMVSAVVVIASLAIVAFAPAATDSLMRVLGLLLSFLGGLVGAATGFYYGRTR